MTPAEAGGAIPALPLFPLRTVLFPGARLTLKVFEARYLDLVGDCLRRQRPFGVVCLTEGGEVHGPAQAVSFAGTGVLARLDDVDAEQAGLLRVSCTGLQRFRLQGSPRQRSDGLWIGDAELVPDDEAVAPAAALHPTVQALARAIERLRSQGSPPFALPHRFDDAGWVANRWCEILPVALAAKQRLMELSDPQVRLQLVHDFLVGQRVVGG